MNNERSGDNSHMLFEHLKISERGKWYKEPSRYYGQYKESLELANKNFHSFRHNFVTQLTRCTYEHETFINSLEEKRKRIIGHSLPDEVTQNYTHLGEAATSSLKQVIDLLEYDIDLSHLYPK